MVQVPPASLLPPRSAAGDGTGGQRRQRSSGAEFSPDASA